MRASAFLGLFLAGAFVEIEFEHGGLVKGGGSSDGEITASVRSSSQASMTATARSSLLRKW